MEPKKSTMLAFYQLLGRVFYATAQADKEINEAEIDTLKQLVKDQWMAVEDAVDEFELDAAYQIEIVFDYLLENDVIEEDVLRDLKEFKSMHGRLFTKQMAELIMETASKIASSFAKRNKSELVFLSKLFLILKD